MTVLHTDRVEKVVEEEKDKSQFTGYDFVSSTEISRAQVEVGLGLRVGLGLELGTKGRCL